MTSPRILATLALVLAVAGCSRGTPYPEPGHAITTAAPASSTTAAPSRPVARPQFQTDWEACSALVGALPPAGTFDPVLLTAIGEAAKTSADFGVRFQGQMLIDTVKLAVAAKGAADEASVTAAAVKAGGDLLAACRKAKLVK